MEIAFHGTNKENALKILKDGFKPYTFFSHHLEDALEFGGTWVFMVRFYKISDYWEFRNARKIPPSRIKRLTEYRPIVRHGYQETFTRREKAIHKLLTPKD